MGKISQRYLDIDPWGLKETGFHPERNQVSESLFSLGNEYMGVRGYFEEGISLPSLIGTYYNGIIEYGDDQPSAYKGIARRTHFTINSANGLKVEIRVEEEKLDLAKVSFDHFVRTLDFHTGLYAREFVWHTKQGDLFLRFERLVGMEHPEEMLQRIHFRSEKPMRVQVSLFLDGRILHWGYKNYWKEGLAKKEGDMASLFQKTLSTHQSLLTAMRVDFAAHLQKETYEDKWVQWDYELNLKGQEEVTMTRFLLNLADPLSEELGDKEAKVKAMMAALREKGFEGLREENRAFFARIAENGDIEIEGSDEDQQGIRFCLFQLIQAYTGYAQGDNIGAKGLTGEAYSGHAFWDSETYCLPYYLFTSLPAAKGLLMFRYDTLEEAKKRAKDLDCDGACFPIATRTGEEACTLWQHASTQIQPTTAVAYAIKHYVTVSQDTAFLKQYGAEMLAEILKFLYTRGDWNPSHTAFGYYGVMGPDEFQVMVNHNQYTNIMGKKMMEYAISVLENPAYVSASQREAWGISPSFLAEVKDASAKMRILYDEKTHLFEQHCGYFDLPHIDVDKIPATDFPLYSHWSYDHIYRNDMIKQPDVLMFLFLCNGDFTYEQKKANYEFYEPRCIHESSLSPSVHSILAEELGKEEEALRFFGFATRLDLDDYNRNTREGLHMTSIAAAWMNIVYGFLGLRSDQETLSLDPHLPAKWTHYAVRLAYRGAKLKIDVYPEKTVIAQSGKPVTILLRGQSVRLEGTKEFAR